MESFGKLLLLGVFLLDFAKIRKMDFLSALFMEKSKAL
jgi:hypothetical protein